MLDGTTGYPEIATRDDISTFLQAVIADRSLAISDIEALCSHAPENRLLRPAALVGFLRFIGAVVEDSDTDAVSLTPALLEVLGDEGALIRRVVVATLRALFDRGCIADDAFLFDNVSDCYIFRNDRLDLKWASVRNLLISCGFLEVVRDEGGAAVTLRVSAPYLDTVVSLCREFHLRMSITCLQKKLADEARAGELAEEYVLAYEKRRMPDKEKAERIKRISTVDVCAGYDIVSFESSASITYDRYIEVKASSHGGEFYLSRNEIETARLYRTQYCLCLVDLSKTGDPAYVPEIIVDPVTVLASSVSWVVEPSSFRVHRVLSDRRA